MKTKAVGKKTIGVQTATALTKQVPPKSQSVETVTFAPEGSAARSGQARDLQGLSNVQGADSESVDEPVDVARFLGWSERTQWGGSSKSDLEVAPASN